MKKFLIFALGIVAGIGLYTHPAVKEGAKKLFDNINARISK